MAEKRVSPTRLALVQVALEALDRADLAREAIDREGMLTGGSENKMIHVNPLLRVEKDARGQFASIWHGLGLDWIHTIDGRA